LFFTAEIELDSVGDIHLDMSEWRKGYLWVNGRLLGRYWEIGPQQCLYCPGAWLRPGRNQVLVLDLHRLQPATIRCADGLTSQAPVAILAHTEEACACS
jgi:beta-galactosidase